MIVFTCLRCICYPSVCIGFASDSSIFTRFFPARHVARPLLFRLQFLASEEAPLHILRYVLSIVGRHFAFMLHSSLSSLFHSVFLILSTTRATPANAFRFVPLRSTRILWLSAGGGRRQFPARRFPSSQYYPTVQRDKFQFSYSLVPPLLSQGGDCHSQRVYPLFPYFRSLAVRDRHCLV